MWAPVGTGSYFSRQPIAGCMVALNAVFGVAFLLAMVAIAAGLTWLGLQQEPLPSADGEDEAT
jgi:hypothetical protein